MPLNLWYVLLEIFVQIQKTETVLLVKIYRFGPVVGIDNHKATTSFVIRVDKPGNQVINDLTPQVQAAALELAVNSQSSNQERRIRTRMLCIGHLAFQAVPRRLGNHCRFDAVVGQSEGAGYLRRFRIRYSDIAFPQQLSGVQVRIVPKEIV